MFGEVSSVIEQDLLLDIAHFLQILRPCKSTFICTSICDVVTFICTNQYSIDNANGDLFIVALIIKFC